MRFLLLFVACLVSVVSAQKVNTLETIMKTMEASKVVYEIKTMEKPVPVPDRSAYLTTNQYYQVIKGGKIDVDVYELSEKGKKEFFKAEKAFENKDLETARNHYKKALLADPHYTPFVDYIAQTYGMQMDYKQAEIWYKKAIEQNFVDNFAHWMLADIYMLTNRKELALEEIAMAKVLNRNNPRLDQHFKKICLANGLDTTSFIFNPQVRISNTPKSVTVETAEGWMMYGMAKANWEYEPGYSEGKSFYEKSKELLLAQYTYASANNKNSALIQRLNKAIDKNFFSEFLYYETILPDNPENVFYQDKEALKKLRDYVIEINRK